MRGYVYLICNASKSVFKIGKTGQSIEKRLKQIQGQHYEKLEVYGFIKATDMDTLERDLHREWAEKRITGEWFTISEDDALSILTTHGGTTCDMFELTRAGAKMLYIKSTGVLWVDITRLSPFEKTAFMVGSRSKLQVENRLYAQFDELIELYPSFVNDLERAKLEILEVVHRALPQ